MHTIMSNQSSVKMDTGIGEGQVFSAIGQYKGNSVAIQKIETGINTASMSRQEMLQLKAASLLLFFAMLFLAILGMPFCSSIVRLDGWWAIGRQ